LFLRTQTENTATINQQKRKMSRQHDVLLNLKSKYGRTDSKFCDENSKLTEEYKRITEYFKDMQVSHSQIAGHTPPWVWPAQRAAGGTMGSHWAS
jgi:hypothetical protein